MSKTTNTHNESCEEELTMDSLKALPSSLMSEHSPISLTSIKDLRKFLLQGFRVNLSVSQVKPVPPEAMIEICGLPPSKSLDELSQGYAFSKTYQDYCRLEQGEWRTAQADLFHPTSEPFSATFPKHGIMSDGVCWELRMSEHIINDPDSGSTAFPTPTAKQYGTNKSKSSGSKVRPSLQTMAIHDTWPTPNTLDALPPKSPEALHKEMNIVRVGRTRPANLRDCVVWPTPTAQDNNQVRGEGAAAGKKDRSTTLGGAVRNWPTPSSRDWKGGRQFETMEEKGRAANNTLPDMVNHHAGEVCGLNPDWTEALMGWPVGWTRDEPIEISGWDYAWHEWEPEIPRTLRKCKDRVKRITAIGNGQVPLTMAVAFTILNKYYEESEIEMDEA